VAAARQAVKVRKTKPQTRNNHHSIIVQVDPYYAHGYSILGTMLRGQKDKTDAINAYQMSISLVPGYGEPCLNLAGEGLSRVLHMIETRFYYVVCILHTWGYKCVWRL
jgi:hypothetical protein